MDGDEQVVESSPIERLARMVDEVLTSYRRFWQSCPEGLVLLVPYAMRRAVLTDPQIQKWALITPTGDLKIMGSVPVLWVTNSDLAEPRMLVSPLRPGSHVGR